ncbi:VOC family protein [Herbiconiux sp. CPCC 205716]|uniref:VOC family protein n=1 Tax=Herbiconiux gentiana TaxID=2970912 RepID=A0ABT2GJA1_9MICO|nr:VOC family protein [Herbiconiux gentiana]MCS5716304.1 VOC family protein [Herbiconiux gentiana]
MRLDDVCIVNSDVTASDDFYRDTLGLERRMRNVRFADFVFDSGPRLAMWLRPSIAETVGAAYPTRPGLPFRLVLEVPDARPGPVSDPDGFVLTLAAPSGSGSRPGGSRSRLAEVELAVTDPEVTGEFLETLGFSRASGDPHRYDGGDGTVIALVAAHSLAGSPRLASFSQNGGHVMLAVELDTGEQVDALHESLTARGLAASGAPAVYEWGARSTYFVDPDGYIWEIYAWVETPR